MASGLPANPSIGKRRPKMEPLHKLHARLKPATLRTIIPTRLRTTLEVDLELLHEAPPALRLARCARFDLTPYEPVASDAP